MRRERGFGWVHLIVGLAILGIIVALVVGVKAWVEGYGQARYSAGQVAERTLWQGKETKELAAANAEILRLQAEKDAIEKKHAEAQAAISADYQKRLADEKRARDAAVAAARAGTLVLRDPSLRLPAAGACPGGSAQAEAAPGSGGRDGAAGANLSPEAAAFLLELTGEADQVVEQLTACQQIVRADRSP